MSRYIMLVPIVGTLFCFVALTLYEVIYLVFGAFEAIEKGAISAKSVKMLAVGIVEAVDVFLIAIAVYITSIGLYSLFIDDTLPMPKWLQINDLDDLKSNLVSVVIAVLAVLFLREAVAWDGTRDVAAFGVALALVIVALTFFLKKNAAKKN
ncbi:MAG TPA: YqhA family protein [Paraburkholderia sp.]|uniref:YqhA family protein n=1 Tax=Paraburkholderia sp. TaxID=1926495 RepID=UPI002C36790D|nr:YqhA family protein [Paraburkholderia sp.]HTR06708.1 YqhA family protein [Paraburkholderia sp.]